MTQQPPSALRITRFALIALLGLYMVLLALLLIAREVIDARPGILVLLDNVIPFLFIPLLLIIPALLLLRGWWLLPLAVVLLIVGGALIGPYYFVQPVAASGTPTLSIITFNVFRDNKKMANVEAWIRQINPDVVQLQELPAGYGRDGIPGLKDLYPYQFAAPQPRGNIVLSRYPFRSSENRRDITQVYMAQRVVLDMNGQAVTLYNMHFMNPIEDNPDLAGSRSLIDMAFKYDDSARNAEIRRLFTFLKVERDPYIVTGDFNMSDQTMMYREITLLMSDSFREAGSGFGGSWPNSEVSQIPDFIPPFMRIDYVWHSPQFRALSAEQGPKLGSDHLPLYAKLELVSK